MIPELSHVLYKCYNDCFFHPAISQCSLILLLQFLGPEALFHRPVGSAIPIPILQDVDLELQWSEA
jgi:hypothetical protein